MSEKITTKSLQKEEPERAEPMLHALKEVTTDSKLTRIKAGFLDAFNADDGRKPQASKSLLEKAAAFKKMTRSLDKGAAEEMSKDPWFQFLTQCL